MRKWASVLARFEKYLWATCAWVVLSALAGIGLTPTLLRAIGESRYELTMTLIFAVLFIVCMMVASRTGRPTLPALSTRNGRPAIDPKKWDFDEETGEYHRITFRHAEGTILDRKTHQERNTKHLKALRESSNLGKLVLVLGIVAAVSWALYSSISQKINTGHASDSDMMIGGLAGFTCALSALAFVPFGLGWLFSILVVQKTRSEVGPAPIPLRYRDEDEDRNVYGEGGFATREDIDRAAQGIAHGAANEQQFED